MTLANHSRILSHLLVKKDTLSVSFKILFLLCYFLFERINYVCFYHEKSQRRFLLYSHDLYSFRTETYPSKALYTMRIICYYTLRRNTAVKKFLSRTFLSHSIFDAVFFHPAFLSFFNKRQFILFPFVIWNKFNCH